MKPRIIIPIGGGEIRKKGTVKIDQEIIRLSEKKIPKLLFIPTASSDNEGYCNHIQKYFGDFLNCKVQHLKLITDKPSQNEIKQKIEQADIIYIGGGNTLKMMKLWRKLEVDKLFKQAYKQGTILTGMSAGSICWFESGHSDSMSFYNPNKWDYINVKALGFLKGNHCPHYNSETLKKKRKDDFKQMIRKTGGMGIALDNNAAIIYKNNTYKVITSKKYAKAYKVYKKNGKVLSIPIEQHKDFRPIGELYRKTV
jgi:dipeptidase E